MDRRQKSALRSSHIRLADELILDEDFYAALRQNKIFTDSMMALIKAEKKPRDRVYKMLELLEKRGPNAFDNFVWILKENYEWLADMLEQEYETRLHRDGGAHPHNHSTVDGRFCHHHHSNQSRQENHRMCQMPALNLRQSMYHTQVPSSATYTDASANRFFPYQPSAVPHMPPPPVSFDNTDHRSVHSNNGAAPQLPQQQQQQTPLAAPPPQTVVDPSLAKQYKDACMSPIGIIESPRKLEQQISQDQAPPPTYQQSVLSSQSCTSPDPRRQNIKQEAEHTSVAKEVRFVEPDSNENIDSTTGQQGTDSDQCEICESNKTTPVNEEDREANPDEMDGAGLDNVSIGVGEEAEGEQADEDNFPTSEVYYEHVRRGSSCLQDLMFANDGNSSDTDTNRPNIDNTGEEYEEFDDDITTAESSIENNPEYLLLLDEMKALYFKLVGINLNKRPAQEEGHNVTWNMINTEVDKLANKLANSNDSNMIKKCYEMFKEKERRLPLNMCIEALMTDIKDAQDRLNDKRREIDQMVYDMWNHQQDMKNIEKLKKNKTQLQTENTRLKCAQEDLEAAIDKQKLYVVQLEVKNQSLETRVRDLEDKISARRGVGTMQRRVSNATTTSTSLSTARRPTNNNTSNSMSRTSNNTGNNSMEPRISLMPNAFSSSQLQSPRGTNTSNVRRNPISRR